MAAHQTLQTLQCPLAWRLQTPATSRLGYCSPADTGGPMGARVSGLTGQWEAGRCKGWHPSVHPVLQIQNTDSGERQPAAVCRAAAAAESCLETEGQ